MNKKISTFGLVIGLVIGLVVGLGMLAFSAVPAIAAQNSPLHSGPNCSSLIQLPQDKEELDLADVKRAVESHLLRIGADNHSVWLSWLDDEVIAVDISHLGNLRRHIKVDAVNAEIIERSDYRQPVGFENVSETQIPPQVTYARQLRRHMLGDGKAWASWVAKGSGIACMDDYRFGGPSMPEPGM